MDAEGFREAAKASVDDIIKYFETLEEKPVMSQVEPGYLRKLLPAEAPQEGQSWGEIQKDVEDKIMPGISHWQSPNFFAFFPCPASYPSLLGEMYSSAFAAACFNWICSPAVTELETVVLDWLVKIFGLPDCFSSTGPTLGGGVIHGTASEALVTVMVAARDKYLRETVPRPDGMGEDEYEELLWHKRSRMVALGSAQAHSSTAKAARVLGLRCRLVPVHAEDGYAMTGEGLRATLEACRAQGLEPFYLTTTLGSTNTCAVDRFEEIADVLDAFAPAGRPGEVFVHVDAAYAGAALVCPEFQAALGVQTLARFHSFNTNMHKWLLTNFDCAVVFIRDRRWFVEALGHAWHVYKNAASDAGLVTDYRDWQIPLGRRFRSLKVWFVLRSYGVGGLQANIRRTVKMGENFADMVRARADVFEMMAEPAFALTVFTLKQQAGRSREEMNALTQGVCETVNNSGKLWVTGTMLDDTYAIRFMTGNRLTEDKHVKAGFETILAEAERVLR